VTKSDEIQAGGDWARGVLESKHKARETTLSACRRTIQACAASIRAVHREEFDTAEELSAQAAAHLAEALAAVEHHPTSATPASSTTPRRSTPRPG
jgi:predicted translin family RNA/ssDNA-binding protein